MKAIAGILHFDARPVATATLETMLASMPRADLSATELWQQGPVALGTVTLRGVSMTAVARPAENRQMITSTQFPHLHIVFDGRIDNRQELRQQLGLDGAWAMREAAASDEELVLACYVKWQADAPAHLIGDFAFAIWDERTQSLFCARDHFGLRPFYMYHGSRCLVFASSLDAILAHPEVPKRINQLRVAFHLAVQPPDNRLTFYQDIERLLPAHSLNVTASGATIQRQFWSIDYIRELRLPTDREYADAFREIFTEAVACRIPQEGPVGVMLSGGLDSTSVASMLHHLLIAGNGRAAETTLHTFSAYFSRTPECDERHYIDATLQLGGITPHFVDVEQSSPLARIDAMLAAMGEPFPSPTLYIPWQIYQEVGKQGVGIAFDGIDGDTAVHHGDAYLAELARASRWPDFFTLASAIAERKKLPLENSLIYRYGHPYLQSLATRWQWFKLYRELRSVAPHATLSARQLFYIYVRDNSLRPLLAKASLRRARVSATNGNTGVADMGVVNPNLVRRTDFADHLRAHARASEPPNTSRQEHYQQLTTPLLPQIFEIGMRAAQAFGIEVRQPYTDRRLIEFCYSLPPEQKVADGWTRNIVRRGLAGIIPEAIRVRGDKALNSRAFTKAFSRRDAETLGRLICGGTEQLAEFVDVPKLHEAYERYRSTQDPQYEMSLWQSATLARWLQQRQEVLETA